MGRSKATEFSIVLDRLRTLRLNESSLKRFVKASGVDPIQRAASKSSLGGELNEVVLLIWALGYEVDPSLTVEIVRGHLTTDAIVAFAAKVRAIADRMPPLSLAGICAAGSSRN